MARHISDQINDATKALFLVGGLNALLGFLATVVGLGLLVNIGVNWVNILVGAVFLGLGVWSHKKDTLVPIGLGAALMMANIGLTILMTFLNDLPLSPTGFVVQGVVLGALVRPLISRVRG